MDILRIIVRHLGHEDHDDDMDSDMDMDMDMGPDNPLIVTDDMNVGTIDVLWFPQLYWIFVGALIAAFTLVNVVNYVLYRQRIHAARKNNPNPAKPRNWLWRAYATLSAVFREASNASLPPLRFRKYTLRSPTGGSFALVSANLCLLMVLCFYALDPRQYLSFQNIGYRTGYVSMAQMPLIFLLAGKRNIIGWLTGCSYERLNWLHRWSARLLLITVTLHMGYWFGNWAKYGYIGTMAKTDPITIRGIAAWAILVWIIFSSFAPIRGWNYEFFVLQHAVSYIAFITMVFLHTPDEDHGWLWAPVAIYLLDRLLRAVNTLYINLAIFHPKQRKAGNYSGAWVCNAELEPLPDRVTRVTIRNPPITWKAGQHAFFSCHSIVPLQSHPFTISSIPSDGKLEFLVKAHRGGTGRFFDWAEKRIGLPTIQNATSTATVAVAIEGPYGKMRPLRQFDSVVLFAGSLGATFTVPLLRDIVHQRTADPQDATNVLQTPTGAATRNIRFVWVVKSRNQIKWFAPQLNQVMEQVQVLRNCGRDIEINMSIYVTCDETFTEDWSSSLLQPTDAVVATTSEESQQPSSLTSSSDEKTTQQKENTIAVQEIDPRAYAASRRSNSFPSSSSSSTVNEKEKPKPCQPDGTCCCATTIRDETTSPSATIPEDVICSCACSHNPSLPSTPSTTTPPQKPTPLLHPTITLLSGRPHPYNITRRALEQAKGESAVVVCGPRGLNGDVRSAVVGLSDERAVCKGSGAMGVWYWGEGFGL